MDVTELRHCIYQLNSEELFYKEQYEARQSGQSHGRELKSRALKYSQQQRQLRKLILL